MPQPVARQGDRVTGSDTHIVLVPSGSGTTPVPTPLPFAGAINGGVSSDVLVNGKPAALANSVAVNQPVHVPPPGTTFQKPPRNRGSVVTGSTTVLVNGSPLARVGDPVKTCNDPTDAPVSSIVSGSPDVLAS
jgi:uncharacterized Zn-binding protein involved in type VI secretion